MAPRGPASAHRSISGVEDVTRLSCRQVSDDDLLLPVGTRVLHIGPHKTGTTTVQFAFHAARPRVAKQGVHYPGPTSQPMFAVYAVTGRLPGYVRTAPIKQWNRLVRGIEESGADRTVVSSEGFCDADDAAIRHIVRDLGAGRVHVVVTVRPLADLLASQWQQTIQDGGRTYGYDAWLETIFNDHAAPVSRSFWHRHRHDQLVERWAAVAGHDHVTVVVVDDRDHDALLRTFEALVGLRTGTLRAQQRTNRSLTRPEIELARALNRAFLEAGLDPRWRVGFVRDGVAELLRRRTVAPDEPRITTPDWARERAADVSREIVAGIAASGVRVLGRLERLTEPPAIGRPGMARAAPDVGAAVGADIAATAPLGVLMMSGLARGGDGNAASAAALSIVSTTQIRRILARRVRRTVAERAPATRAVMRQLRRVRRFIRGRRRVGRGGDAAGTVA